MGRLKTGKQKHCLAGARKFNGKKFFHYAVAWTKKTSHQRKSELWKKGYNVRVTQYKYGWDIWRRKRGT